MELSELRTQIDAIDAQLIELLERRMDVAAGVAEYKRGTGKPVLDAARELEKLQAVSDRCRPETTELITGLFAEIMAASRAFQTRLLEEET